MTNTARITSIFLFTTIALTNYQISKIIQRLILEIYPTFSYTWSLSIPWLLIGIIPIVFYKVNLCSINTTLISKNVRQIILYSLIALIGLALFVSLGITNYFHSVKYPFIFIIITPIVEELIFRGWMYDLSGKISKLSPVLITAILFGLHHLQYFDYRFTDFAIFQITYTFLLGLLFGKIRQKSGAIYLTILLHILINYVSFNF